MVNLKAQKIPYGMPRVCRGCGAMHPSTEEYFAARVDDGKMRILSKCHACHKAEKREINARANPNRVRAKKTVVEAVNVVQRMAHHGTLLERIGFDLRPQIASSTPVSDEYETANVDYVRVAERVQRRYMVIEALGRAKARQAKKGKRAA